MAGHPRRSRRSFDPRFGMNIDLAGRRYRLQVNARRALIAARRATAASAIRTARESTAASTHRGTSWLPEQPTPTTISR
jgi:hypothetical protein